MTEKYDNPTPRVFTLVRETDHTGVSGTGVIASGCEWPDGTVALRWNTETPSTTIFENIERMLAVHGHDGSTRIEWAEDQLMSTMWRGDRYLTWKEAYELRLEDTLELKARNVILDDLDRCQHGRHEKDNCGTCDRTGGNKGNPRLAEDRIIGYDIRGNPYRVPETGTWEPAEKWKQ